MIAMVFGVAVVSLWFRVGVSRWCVTAGQRQRVAFDPYVRSN